jgi:hypothetical protein
MFKSITSALWAAATSPQGKAVLTLGGSWLVNRISKGSPKAQRVVAITAREYGRLEALAGKTGTPIDDLALEVLKHGVRSAADRKLVEATLKLLRDNAATESTIIGDLPHVQPPG